MAQQHGSTSPWGRYGICLLCTTAMPMAWGAGFALMEQNAAGLGDVHAGGAALAADASTISLNPAGLTRLHHRQLDWGSSGVWARGSFSGQAQQNAWDELQQTYPPGAPAYTASGTVRHQGQHLIPAFYLAFPTSRSATWGIGVWAPFGLSTHWDETSFVRYSATHSGIQAMNAGVSVGYRINTQWSWGAGLAVQRVQMALHGVLGAGADSRYDLNTRNDLHSWAPVWHAGVLWQAAPRWRWGLAYQSRAHHRLTGHSVLSKRGAFAIVDVQYPDRMSHTHTARARMAFPGTWIASVVYEPADRWKWMASAYRTQWSVLQTLRIEGLAGVIQYDPLTNTQRPDWSTVTTTTAHHLRDTWFLSVGAHYRFNDQIHFLMGLGYDTTPTRDATRDLRLPGADRRLLGLGIRYAPSPEWIWHVGWKRLWIANSRILPTHLFTVPAQLDDQGDLLAPGTWASASGVHRAVAHVVGAQLSWRF